MDSRLPDGRVAVLLSAHDDTLIGQDAQAIAAFLDAVPCDVAQVAAQLARTRRIRRRRTALRAADHTELTDALRAVAAGREHPLVTRGTERADGRTAFVFPGQGSQWPAMGADLYHRSPVYRAEVDRCADAFTAAGAASPLQYLTTNPPQHTFAEVEVQGAQFSHAVGLAAVWCSCGISPDLTLGHSLGEIAAAHVAGAVGLADAVAVLIARATVIERLSGDFGMAVLGVDAAQAAQLIAETPGWLELSVVNATSSVVISGDRAAVAAVVARLDAQGRFARALPVGFPAHTSALEPLRAEFRRLLPEAVFADTPVQFIGSATGDTVGAGTNFESYWDANLRNTVRFDRAADTAIACHTGTFIEMSAHPSLLFAVEDALDRAGASAVLSGSGRRDEPTAEELTANITTVALTDARFRWSDLCGTTAAPLSGFPPAPMRAEHLWATPEPLPPAPRLTVTVETWEPAPVPAAADRSVAVVELGDVDLTACLRAHTAAVSAPMAEADILLVVAPRLDIPDAVTAAEKIAALIDAGLLGYPQCIGPRCRDVWLVTVGAEQVRPVDPVPAPGPAALAALHRGIGFEFPDQAFHHLDLRRDADERDLTAAVTAVLTGAGELAVRDGLLYRRSLGSDVSDSPAWDLTTGMLDDVLITGGSGTIGRSYVKHLAAAGARRIVLLSRRGVDREVLDALTAGHDVEVLSVACDLTDKVRLAAAAAELGGAGASLVIHAAGTAVFADLAGVTGASVIDMAAAKLAGLATLCDTWPIRGDARMLLCSSVTGVWGGKGVAAYGAVNRMLDVTAAQLRHQGRRCVAVRWGLWAGSGIVDATEIARSERAGMRQMDPAAAVEAGLCEYPADPLVLDAEPDRLRVFFGQELADGTAPRVGPAPEPDPPTPLPPADAVRTHLAEVLDTDAAALDLDASLFDLGIDSLLALDLRKRLRRSTGRTVPLAALLGGITGTDLIADLEAGTTPQKVDSSRD